MSTFTVTYKEVNIYVNKEITYFQTLLEMGNFASSLNSETSQIYWLTTKKLSFAVEYASGMKQTQWYEEKLSRASNALTFPLQTTLCFWKSFTLKES